MALDFTALGIAAPQNGWHFEETSGTTLADSYGNADATVFDDGEGPTLNLDTDLGLPSIGSGVEGPGAARTPLVPGLANPAALTVMAVVEIRLWQHLPIIVNYGPAGGSTTDGTFFIMLRDDNRISVGVTQAGSFDSNLQADDFNAPLDEPLVYFLRWTAGNPVQLYRGRMNDEVVDFDLIDSSSSTVTLSGNADDGINLMGPEEDSTRWVDGKGDEVHIWTEALSVEDMESISNAVYSENGSGNGVDGEIAFTGSNAVIFADDSEPAEGATVYAVRPGEVEAASTGTTDANGEVTLTGLDAGTYATWAERDDGTGNIQTTQVIKREVT